MSGNEEFIQEFLVECEENLDQLDRDLVALEKNPRDPDRLASIFRTIHTIKGTSGFFGYAKLGAVTHAGENLLGRLRDGELTLDPDLTNALLQLADTVREILASIEKQGQEGDRDYGSVITRLEVLAAQSAASDAKMDQPSESGEGESQKARDSAASDAEEALQPLEPPRDDSVSAVEPTPSRPDSADEEREEQADELHRAAPGDEPLGDAQAGDPRQVEAQTGAFEGELHQGVEPDRDQQERDEGEPVKAAAAPSQGTVRVDVNLLNELMNQVGELVLARNQVRPYADSIEDRGFNNALQQLDLITGDLQEGITKTRLQPIANLWGRLPRVVRDLAQANGKQVQLEMHGHETELDRTLLEAIKDPLTHLVRNAVDHGIESPGARREAGKPEMGRVVLRAFHEGGLVNIEITDDGAGIDPERVREKALRQGLISREQASQMSARQITQLIFQPGLSTAERVTDISGRGVGMDVVKTNIERIGGSVAIDSRPGHGTKLRVKIPLTLAIVPVLMVTSGGQRFAIPQVSLREIITLNEAASSKAVESVGDALVYRLRGELLPLISLADVLQTYPAGESRTDELAHVVVLQAIGQRFGLIVDQIARTEEIVVKPLHTTLAQIPVFSGATVLGDGRVALILDVAGIARTAGAEQRDQAAVDEEVDEAEDIWEEEISAFGDYLICEAAPGRRVAIAFHDVARLEEFAAAQVQTEGGRSVIPYRDHLMPLLSLNDHNPPHASSQSFFHVVVHAIGARHVGLIMQQILDITPAAQAMDTCQQRAGVHGRVLVGSQVLEVVDIEALAHAAGISFPTEREPEVAS